MSTKVVNIGKNAVEDGVEDFFQALIYRRMRKYTEPFLKDFSGDSEFDEAMQSFINTLSAGLSIYAFTKVTSFFFSRGAKLSGFLWSYIVAGKIQKKMVGKLKNSKLKGTRAFKTLSLVLGSDRTAERVEIAKMMQSSIDSFDNHKFHYQNQHQKTEGTLNNFMLTGSNLKTSIDSDSMELVLFKTKNAMWKNTKKDRKLYEKATGNILAESGEGSWTTVHQKLNTLTDLFITLEGEASNLATVLTKVLAKNGAVK